MSYPSSIQAITFAKTGDFDVIEKTTQPFPNVGAGDIVVKVQYGGVNFIDTYFRKGLYPIKSFPAFVGQEASGIIVGLPTDQAVLDDPEFKKRAFATGSKVAINTSNVFAEYAAVSWTDAFPVPSSLPNRLAAAGVLQGITAVSFMDEGYDVQKGDIVLIHTVAGGLGMILSQYAKSKGATVIGTTSTKEKAALAKAHGADHVILYTEEDTVKRVLEITGNEGVHAIFDGVGKDTFDNNFKMIRRKGSILTLGNASGAVPPFAPLKLVEKNVKLMRPTMKNYIATPEEGYHYSSKVLGLIADGTIKIDVHKDYPFTAEGVIQAQKDLTGGKTTGKLIIDIAPE
ncbi:NAD-P-binding protein [Athelia psychrophila]|uniref:Probable quinone oxidoreductase n=1 Tax=Athelia psychrophila TaxID=1759441 RepID=A0A166S120_9AGAM|nr:NAD-P-binding protein [Fibularhizoctonia sp. CBS 109695]